MSKPNKWNALAVFQRPNRYADRESNLVFEEEFEFTDWREFEKWLDTLNFELRLFRIEIVGNE